MTMLDRLSEWWVPRHAPGVAEFRAALAYLTYVSYCDWARGETEETEAYLDANDRVCELWDTVTPWQRHRIYATNGT